MQSRVVPHPTFRVHHLTFQVCKILMLVAKANMAATMNVKDTHILIFITTDKNSTAKKEYTNNYKQIINQRGSVEMSHFPCRI